MKKEVLVPVITSSAENLVARMNESVRMMNLMVDQLYWQKEKMDELKLEKEKYPEKRKKRVQSIEEMQKRFEERTDIVSALEKELKELSVFDLRRRYCLTRDLKVAREHLSMTRTSLLQANHNLNMKDDHNSRIDIEIETVLMPNYKNHLAKFYSAYRAYNDIAKKFKAITGVDVPEIEVDKIILYNGEKGEFPVANIDYQIPRLQLELTYDEFDEIEDDDNLLI